jgi:aminoglycoside 6'-N-acetyltransferase
MVSPTDVVSEEGVMELRPATPNDLEVLRCWDEPPHVVAADPHDDWAWEVELERSPGWREQLMAEVDGRPVGFLQLIDPALEESRYWGDIPSGLRAIDIWIGEEADLGKGYGTEMRRLALARCFKDPAVSAVLIDPLASNVRTHRFCERLGFQFVERRRFGEDECFVYRLERSSYTRIAQQGARLCENPVFRPFRCYKALNLLESVFKKSTFHTVRCSSRRRKAARLSLSVIATRGREFYCWTQQGSCDSAMVWCRLFPTRGCVAGNGGVPSTR